MNTKDKRYKPAVVLVEKQSRNGVVHMTPVRRNKGKDMGFIPRGSNGQLHNFGTALMKDNGNNRKNSRAFLIHRPSKKGNQVLLRRDELILKGNITSKELKELKEIEDKYFIKNLDKIKLRKKYINRILVDKFQ